MAEGQVYVEVDASAVGGGIMPMAIVSSNPVPEEGQTYVVVWIRWRYENTTGEGGYTGIEWYFDDPDNYLKNGSGCSSEKDFRQWLVNNTPENFDALLSNWPAATKSAFLNKYTGDLWEAGCLFYGH